MRQEIMGFWGEVASAGPYENNYAPRSRQITTPTPHHQWHSQDLEVGAQEVSHSWVQEQIPGGGARGKKPPKAHSILWIFCCQTMQNFMYLAKM